MQVIIKGGFTYTAEFFIKEEAYAKLISAAKTYGKDKADAILCFYLKNEVYNLRGICYKYKRILKYKYIFKMLIDSTISFRTFFPSNHVTISVYGNESKEDIDPNLKEYRERHQEIADLLAREFKLNTDRIEFISGELNFGDILDKEKE